MTGSNCADEKVFTFQLTSLGATTSGTFGSPIFFDGSAWGLSGNDLVAIDLRTPPALSQRSWQPEAAVVAPPTIDAQTYAAVDALFQEYSLERPQRPFRPMRGRANRFADLR